MKKIFVAIIALLLLSIGLTSCGFDVPRPEVKEGRFNIIVTYEHNVNRNPFVSWKESYEGDLGDDGIVRICNTDDGGEIFISFLMYPEYFMGDPEAADRTPLIRVELWYPDEQIDDVERIAEHGVKLIGYEYDDPIENTYK